jgi:hypothetical protein
MGDRFNPPAGWPTVPPQWAPAPGWQPVPAPPGLAPPNLAPPVPTLPPPPPKLPWPDLPAANLQEFDDFYDEAQLTAPIPVQPPARPPGSPAEGPRHRQGAGGPPHRRTRSHPRRSRPLPPWVWLVIVMVVAAALPWVAGGLLPWVLIAIGVVATGIGTVGLLRGPLPRIKVASRPAAAGALLLGVAVVGAGSALATTHPAPATPPATTHPAAEAPVAPPVIPLEPTTEMPYPTTVPPTTPPPTTPASTAPATTRPPTTSPPRSPRPTARPTQPAPLCGAPANPYGFNFCGRGGLVYQPPAAVCSYFDCVSGFPDGTGYLEECRDHSYSLTGGQPAACAKHGGSRRTVYRGP